MDYRHPAHNHRSALEWPPRCRPRSRLEQTRIPRRRPPFRIAEDAVRQDRGGHRDPTRPRGTAVRQPRWTVLQLDRRPLRAEATAVAAAALDRRRRREPHVAARRTVHTGLERALSDDRSVHPPVLSAGRLVRTWIAIRDDHAHARRQSLLPPRHLQNRPPAGGRALRGDLRTSWRCLPPMRRHPRHAR